MHCNDKRGFHIVSAAADLSDTGADVYTNKQQI